MASVREDSSYRPLNQVEPRHDVTESDQGYNAFKQPHISTTTTIDGDMDGGGVRSRYDDNSPQKGTTHHHQGGGLRRLSIWRYELACGALCLGALCAVIATLLPFQHKPLPQWRYGLSLNTLVSIYIVILRGSMLFVASQCLSHLKWLWFENEHKLLDVDTYDAASRGPLGSFMLLWRIRAKSLTASLGALVTIAALIIDPFAQQVVSSYSCRVEVINATASLNKANSYIKTYYGGVSNVVADLAMQKAINAGIYNPGLSPPFRCETGNCTFPTPYNTLGFCSRCTDMTSQLRGSISNSSYVNFLNQTLSNVSYIVTLPTDLYGLSNVSAYISNANSLVFAVRSYSNTQDIVAAVTTNSTDLAGIVAPNFAKAFGARCFLDPCIQTCTAAVQNFTLNETVLSSRPLREGLNIDPACISSLSETQLTHLAIERGNDTVWPIIRNVSFSSSGTWYHLYNGSDFTPDPIVLPPRCVYGVNYQAMNDLRQFINTFLTGGVTVQGSNLWNIYGSSAPLLTMYNMSWVTFEGIDATFNNISDAITTQIRTDNSVGYYKNVGTPSESGIGQAYETTVCARVRWGFLVYPAAIVLLAGIFFAATIMHKRDDVHVDWKSSQVALLFHGLRQDTIRDLDRKEKLRNVRDMESAAKNLAVSLQGAGSGLYLGRAESELIRR